MCRQIACLYDTAHVAGLALCDLHRVIGLGLVLTRMIINTKYLSSCFQSVENRILKQAFSNASNSTKSLFGLVRSISLLNLGVYPTRRGVSHETEANHANRCLVVNCFRGQIHQSREAGPPSGRRATPDGPQPRQDSPRLQKENQSRCKPILSCLFALCLPNYATSTNLVKTLIKRSIDVSPSLLPSLRFGAALAHSRNPKSDRLIASYGKMSVSLAAALRGGRTPSLTSSVANACFSTSTRLVVYVVLVLVEGLILYTANTWVCTALLLSRLLCVFFLQ